MKMLILDTYVSDDLIARRQKLGIDKSDEVWDGVYVMSPLANNDHQDFVLAFGVILHEVVMAPGLGRVQAGANVSDLNEDWTTNFRCPDVVVVLADGKAIDRVTHWQGGPDFLVEVMSPGDDTLEKLPFYAGIGVREVLVVGRDTREPTLYRLNRKRLTPAAATDGTLVSAVVPLAFRRVDAKKVGPRLEVRRTAGRKKTWLV